MWRWKTFWRNKIAPKEQKTASPIGCEKQKLNRIYWLFNAPLPLMTMWYKKHLMFIQKWAWEPLGWIPYNLSMSIWALPRDTWLNKRVCDMDHFRNGTLPALLLSRPVQLSLRRGWSPRFFPPFEMVWLLLKSNSLHINSININISNHKNICCYVIDKFASFMINSSYLK